MVALKQGPTYVKDFDYDEFRNYLNELGDSLLVVNDDEIVKVHVHTCLLYTSDVYKRQC